MTNPYNNETTLCPLSGKIWITKGEPGKGGKNVCARFDSGNFMVIGFLSNDQQLDPIKHARNAVIAMGWNPNEWM